ncbi:MAG TPA: hypothetical protein VGL97_14275 [Bryobacteraceae bacterium]|jgi:hypothetical protein
MYKKSTTSLSRRRLLGSALGAAASATFASGANSSGTPKPFRSILLPSRAPLPLKTAANELAQKTGAAISERAHMGMRVSHEIVLAVGEEVRYYPTAASRVPAGTREWELVHNVDDGLLIAGSTARNVCKAALGWMENPVRETGRLSTYAIEERFTMWDNSLNQMYRFSKGFDRQCHIREIARLGHTGIEVNRYADPGGYHVIHRKFVHDSYAWYLSYAPALDAFVESSLTQGIYHPEELAANLADFREAAGIARSYGLKPGFVCYEPRCAAEAIFDRYPGLRGSRTDHPGRSLEPRYALDIANPRVLEHYAELLTNLMKEAPDLRYLVYWTQDSGSGLPFAQKLYFGPNGSFLARSKTIEKINFDFSRTLVEAGRKINPEFEVIMEIGHEYTEDERKRITGELPDGVTLSHPLAGSLLKNAPPGGVEKFIREDREDKVNPYVTVTVSGGFDAEPIIGVPAPGLLMQKLSYLEPLNLRRVFTTGGTFSPPQCLFQINQELYAEFLRGGVTDLASFLLQTALHWCGGDNESAHLLAEAWEAGDTAIASWPKLSWYSAGPGQTQARWITRPLVPDLTKLDQRERAAWERALFTLPWDVGRWNIAFEGGIRLFQDEDLDRAVQVFDQQMIPGLEKTIAILNRAMQSSPKPVIEDQRDRYLGLLLRSKGDRNLFDGQVAINYYLLKHDNPEAQRQRLRKAIEAEAANTKLWIQALSDSKTVFFHTTTREETPFLYRTPIDDLKLKLSVMEAHKHDEPGPDLKEIASPKPKLQFSAVQ